MIPQDRTQVLAEGLDYVARIEEAGLIDVKFDEARGFERENSYFGYKVFDAETPEFRQLADAYGAARIRQEQTHYLSIALSLLDRLPTEPDDVLLDSVVNNVRASPYYNRPVLAAVPPAHFVERVLTWDPKTQTNALELLQGRHELQHGLGLIPERAWVQEVDRLLSAALPALQPMSRFRLQLLIDRNLAPLRPPPVPVLTPPSPNTPPPPPPPAAP